MSHREISIDAIDPNPHRNFTRNPIKRDQVEKIVESIGRTGFWDNVVVRVHPDKPGRYQLAYGHNRLEACRLAGIKTVSIPVRDLGTADMYDTMVDENETQQTISPEIAFENVEAAYAMLEEAFKAVGPEGTEKAFYQYLGRVVSAETTRDGHGFEQVRSDFFGGQGIGRRFLERFIRSGRLSSADINEILKSHKAKKRQDEAEQAEAEADEAEAAIANAEDEKDREAREERARKAREKADKKRAMAEEIAGDAIAPDILLSFKTRRQMTDFAAAIRYAEIPSKHHKKASDYIKKKEVHGESMKEKLASWWYEFSGQKAKDREKRLKEEVFKAFCRRVKGGDFEAYLRELLSVARKLTDDMNTAAPAAPYYENQKLRESACKNLKELTEAARQLFNGLNGEPIMIDLNNGKVKQLTYS